MSQELPKKEPDDDDFQDATSKTNDEIINEIITENTANFSIKEDSNGNVEAHSSNDVEVFDDDFIDEEGLKELEKEMTEDEKLAAKENAEQLKNDGNNLFKNQEFKKSIEKYTNALKICPTVYPNERAILYGNRAAAKIKLDSKNSAIDDCSKAIELNPHYIRAILRRAKLYEDTEKLDESLEDYKKVIELDPKNTEAQQALSRLPPLINERNEKLKKEMIGKLKDLGNMFLKPFGLSTDNFQMQQDPNTGSYSINFKQNEK